MRAVLPAVVALVLGGPLVATDGPEPPSLHNGQIVTVAGGGQGDPAADDALGAYLDGVLSIEVGPDGTIYVAERYPERLRKIDPDGTIETVEGVGVPESGESESPDSFMAPYATAVGPDGSVVVAAELGISRIDPSGEVAPVTGTGDNGDDTDGQLAADIRLVRSSDIAVDGAGNIYLADPVTARIRKIDTAGVLSTVAGGGDVPLREGAGQAATSADVGTVSQLDVDSQGNVYFMVERGAAVFKVDAAGVLSMVTGTASGFGGDGGPAIEAKLDGASAIAVDAEDNLFIADGNDLIRMVDSAGIITTVGPDSSSGVDIAVGPTGDIYLASDSRVDMLVRSAEPADRDDQGEAPDTGESRWAAEEPGTIQHASDAELGPLTGLAVDREGTLYLADGEELATVDTDGTRHPIPAPGPEFAAAPALATASAVATTETGDLYAVIGTKVVRVYPDGAIVTVAGGGPEGGGAEDGQNALTATLEVTDIAAGPDGELFIADSAESRVFTLDPDGTITAFTELSGTPGGMAVGPDGTVYVAMPERNEVVAVDANGANNPVAGSATFEFEGTDIGDGGPATEAVVIYPGDVAVDSAGNLYVSTSLGIRRVDSDGIITTVYSTANAAGDTLASGDSVVTHLAIGAHDDLYYFESPDHRVNVMVRPGEIADPFPWMWVIIGGATLVVVLAIAVVFRRRRSPSTAKGAT